MIESGLPFPEESLLDAISLPRCDPGLNPDRGGYTYSTLHETTLDEVSGLDWMVTCIVSFIVAARRCTVPSNTALVRRMGVCLLIWIIQEDLNSSTHTTHNTCPIKRSSTTLSLSTEVKVNIYRGIIASELLPDYLLADPFDQWTLALGAFLQRHLGSFSRDVLETCHEIFLLHRLTRSERRLPEDTTCSQFNELSSVIFLTDCLLMLMTAQLRLMQSQRWERDKIFATASSWCAPSWRWIFQDILAVAKRVEADQPQLYIKSGLSNLSESIASFANQIQLYAPP
jgi:hypothetical protein